MQSFRHIEPPLRLFAGDDCLGGLAAELARLDATRPVLLCGRSMAADPALDLLRRALGDCLVGICAEVRPHSPRRAVEAAAQALAALNADAIVAVGGGSAMVTARAAAILLGEGKPVDQLATTRDAQGRLHSPRLDARKLPIIAIPTTPSTAVAKPGSAVLDKEGHRRLALFDPKTRPVAIFLEPALLMTPPAALVRAAAVNTLASAIEGLVAAPARDRLSQGVLAQAVRLTARQLGSAPDDPKMRSDLAMAAILCGRGTDNTGLGLATVIGHAVATACDVDGGMAKMVALPYVLDFNRDHIGEGLRVLAQALDCPPDGVAAALSGLIAELGLPRSLRDLSVPQAALPDIAQRCMEDWFIRSNPRPVSNPDEVLRLLHRAW